MPHCHECGTKLPEDEEAEFCPNCGASIKAPPGTLKHVEVSETKSGTLRRGRTMIVTVLVCLVVTFIGATLPIDAKEAQTISQEFGELETAVSSFGVPTIFGNNLMHTLAMFTPIAGPAYGSYVLFSTGRVVAAVALTNGVSPLPLLMYVLILPHAWIEYASYALALSESLWVTLAIFRHRFRDELANVFKAISICALLLLSAAFIETSLLSLFA